MKTFTLTQSTKQHNPNRLHDAFIAAQVVPVLVESTADSSIFTFADQESDAAIQAVITSYTLVAPPAPINIRTAWQAYDAAVNSATTVPQLKAAMTDRLGVLLKELLKTREAGL